MAENKVPRDVPTHQIAPRKPTFQDKIMAENTVPPYAPTHQITPRKPAFDKDYLITTEDKEAFYFLTYSYSKAEVVQIDDHVLTIEQLRRNVTGGFMYDQVRPFSIASRSSCLQMSDVTYIANLSGYKCIRTYK
jgi:hypothetical protein